MARPDPVDRDLAVMDDLIGQVHSLSPAATAASQRIMDDRTHGRASSLCDRLLVDDWLGALLALALLSCQRRDPDMKAHGALLQHHAETIASTLGIDSDND